MSRGYKKQHFVTQSYLKAWLDPNTPEGQEPYVWVISKDGKEVRRKAPKNVFAETNFYTVYDEEGNRVLELEHKLSEIENDFIKLRDYKLNNRQPITDADMQILVLFIATMFSRTEFQRELQKEMWQELLDLYDELPFDRLLSEERKSVKRLKDQPMPFHMFNFVNIVVPFLLRMNLSTYEIRQKQGFITSDNPCIWFDPSVFIAFDPSNFFGLLSPDLDISIPISPTQLTRLTWTGPENYIVLENQPDMIAEYNKLITIFADNVIINNKNTTNPYWFDKHSEF